MSRVCLVVPGFSTAAGDGCIPALREFALALGALHQVTVVALRYPHTRTPYTLGPLRVIPLGGAFAAGAARGPLLARAIAAVRRAGPFDVVQGLWADEPGFVAAAAGRALRARVIVSLMGGELAALPSLPYGGQLERLGPRLTRLALRGAHVVTVGSPWLARRVTLSGHRPPPQLMPLGLTDTQLGLAQRRPPRAHGGPLRVGMVASLLPVKGPGLLIDAAARAAEQGAALALTVVGEGPLRTPLQARARGAAVTFTGHLTERALAAQLGALDLVVQASWWESQGMAVLEAAAAGCAVGGTAVGALADLDAAYVTLAPGSPRSGADALTRRLADALVRAAAHRDEVAASGAAAAAEVRARYTVAQTLDAWHAAARR